MRKIAVTLFAVAILAAGAVYLLRPTERDPDAPPIREGVPKEGKVVKTDEEWKAILPAEVYYVTRQKGTERPFTGATWNTKKDGVYRCACCDQPLFDSSTKFDSGTGWPSFWKPIDENAVSLFADNDAFMQRVEVVCSRCGGHLGHVFDDGPKPTGQRYCMNSAAMKFEEKPKP